MPSDARAAAEAYTRRGWRVIPIPHRTKKNKTRGWQRWRLDIEDLDEHFPAGKPMNVGVLLGEPSGWLVDVDLDHPRAVELAPKFCPPTPLVFGRPGKPRSHWLYRVTQPVCNKKWASVSSGMIVEVRSTGVQTVFPPSTHESGEPIEWEDEGQEPAEVDPAELLEAAERLANTVKVELGEKPRAKAKIAAAHANATGESISAAG